MKIVLLILALITILTCVRGITYERPVKTIKTATGRNITKCVLDNGMEVLDGSFVRLASCEECICNDTMLSCRGIGLNVGKDDAPPSDCTVIKDGCMERLVLRADQTKDCFTEKSILVHPFDNAVYELNENVPLSSWNQPYYPDLDMLGNYLMYSGFMN